MSELNLFQPYALGPLNLEQPPGDEPHDPHAALDEARDGQPLMAEYYAQRAGAGLIVTEGIAPSADGKGYTRIPGLWSPEQTESWKQVTAAVHAKGGHIFAQLMHTGRVSHPANMDEGAQIVAPSAVALARADPYRHTGHAALPMPKALDEAGIRRRWAPLCRRRAMPPRAGFDGIELHSANGYLLAAVPQSPYEPAHGRLGATSKSASASSWKCAHATASAIGAEKVGIRAFTARDQFRDGRLS